MITMFIAGVLFGWLLEALFVKFVLGKPLSLFTGKAADSEVLAKATQALKQCEDANAALSEEVSALKAHVATEKAAHEKVQAELADRQAQLDACQQRASELALATPAKTPDETKQQEDEPAQPVVASDSDEVAVDDVKTDDDLTKLAGIGPKIASLMQAAGMGDFAKIANTDVDTLCEELTKKGIPYSKATVATWAEQARYAQQGDWQGLKSYQEGLKS